MKIIRSWMTQNIQKFLKVLEHNLSYFKEINGLLDQWMTNYSSITQNYKNSQSDD